MIKTDTQSIIGRLLSCFTINRPDPEGFLDEFAKAIEGTNTEVLHRAVDAGLREWKFFPLPAEVLEIVRRQNPVQTTPNKFRDYEDLPSPSDEEKARSRFLMKNLFAHLDHNKFPKNTRREPLRRIDRDTFEEMQRSSCNAGLHTGKMAAAGERE